MPASAGTPFSELTPEQWVWICEWHADPNAGVAKKKTNKPKKAESKIDLPRIAARVNGAPKSDSVELKPMWGDICVKCKPRPEYDPKINNPATITCTTDTKFYPLRMEVSNIEGRADMTEMADLGVGELMHCLRKRYKQKPMIIYTYVGEILIAMNPMEDIGLTTLEVKQRYHGKKLGDPTVEPNIYAIGDAAYHALVDSQENQAIVISGESGAGKSESTKQVLEYITFCSSLSGAKSPVNDQILATSESLEAFGNAKTKRNHNSSRFGKLVTIQFGPQGGIKGAEIIQYLLEKSRIVAQEEGERGYHVFYQMLTSLPNKADYHMKEVKDYKFLIGPSGKNLKSWPNRPDGTSLGDEDNFKDIFGPGGFMEKLKMDGEFLDTLWRCMASVLLIGEIDFKSTKSDGAEFGNPDAVKHIAEMLRVEEQTLADTLLKKKVMKTFKIFNAKQATDNAASLAKGIYGAFFIQMVEKRINSVIGTNESDVLFIGVLDIFGFESFEEYHVDKWGKWVDSTNKFEQLCINLTNEQLQHYFYEALIPKQMEKYERENLTVETIYWADNQPCLNMCMGKGAKSLFGLLNGVSKQAMGLIEFQEHPEKADQKWLADIKNTYKGSEKNLLRADGSRMKDPKDFISFMLTDPHHHKDETDFCVYHYAGQVWYNIGGAVESNKNKLSEDLTGVLCDSKDEFIAGLLRVEEGDKSYDFVSAMFAASLRALDEKLHETHPFFVRCVKPNCVMERGGFLEDHKVLDQLVCAGMTAVIEMRKNGYPVERSPHDFAEDYSILEDDKSKLLSMTDDEKVAYLCQMVEDKWGADVQNEDGMRPWQIGLTKVFLKDEMFKAMNKERAEAKAKLREKQKASVEHIKALYKMAKEFAMLEERRATYEKNKKIFARKKELMAPPMNLTEEQALKKIEEEEAAERAAAEAAFKAEHFDPVAADLQPALDKVDPAVADYENFMKDEKNAERLAKNKDQVDELKKKKEMLQKVFGIFKENVHDESAEARTKELIEEVNQLTAQAATSLEADKAAREDEIARASEIEAAEKEAERQKKAEEEAAAKRAEEDAKEAERQRVLMEKKKEADDKEAARKAKIQAEKDRRRKEKEKVAMAKEEKRRGILEAKEKELEKQRRHAAEQRRNMEREEKLKAKRRKEEAKRKRKQEEALHARANALITDTYVKYKDVTCKVCFVGKLPYSGSPEYVGMMFPEVCQLTRPLSEYGTMSDGSLQGIQMFPCPKNRGKFVTDPEATLLIIQDSTEPFKANDLVWQMGTERVGRVRYVGTTDFDKTRSTWLGVELDEELSGEPGKNDGTVQGKFYFNTTRPRSGIMGKPKKFCLVQKWSEEFVQAAVEQWKVLHETDLDDSYSSSDIEFELEEFEADLEAAEADDDAGALEYGDEAI